MKKFHTYFTTLKNKEVVNVRDGNALGCICDLEIDPCTGQVLRLILPGEGITGFFSAKKRIFIPWRCVERIGDDVILVRLEQLPEGKKDDKCSERKDCVEN